MELLDGLANEQVPAAKAAIEQRRQARAPVAAVDGSDAGDERSVGRSDSEDDGNDDQGIEGDEREEMRLVEEDALEDGPADDLLDGLDDMPVEVRERIQAELEPQYEDGMHARARELRSPEHMQRAAERQLRLLVEDMNGRYEVLDADAEVTRHLDADVVVEAFRAWLNLTPNRVMSEALAWDSLAELWNAFELEYRHVGFGQLTVVAHHVLALPASEGHTERLNKILRRICRKAGRRLCPRQKVARLIVAAA